MMACQNCGFDLQGLPQAYSCPECGVEYDEYSTVIKLDPARPAYSEIVLAAWLLLGSTYAAWWRPWEAHDSPVLLIVLLAAVAVALWRIARSYGSEAIVLVGRSGVDFRRSGLKAGLMCWDALDSSRVLRLSKRFVLYGKGSTVLLRIPVRKLGSMEIAQRCESAINGGLQDYGSGKKRCQVELS